MAEDLGKKKRIRAGSATRTIRQITETLESETPDRDRLSLLRVTLQEKLDTIKTLDAELIDDEAEEIEQADACKETMYEAILKVDRLLNNSPTTRTRQSCTSSESSQVTQTSASRWFDQMDCILGAQR